MKKVYMSEIEGMADFYSELQLDPSYVLNTDGVIFGTLFEFKKTTSSNSGEFAHIKQIKRYIKAYNSAALDIPSVSFIIYINNSTFIKINNENFKIIERGEWKNPKEFKEFVSKNHNYIKGWIDEFSIAAYNNRYCKSFKNANKDDIKREFINPSHLRIKKFDWDAQIKLEEKSSDKIGWLHFNIDILGNALLKKQLGAYFTPDEYVKKATEYLNKAVDCALEQGYEDYLIIDRCAGTGNLQRFLNEEQLSRCVLNTIDYTEWTTLKGLYDGRVKLIIPPTNDTRGKNGLMSDGNALSKGFNDFLIKYLAKVDRSKVYIIFLENPPFRDETSTLTHRDKASRKTKTFIDNKMSEDPKIKGAMKNELSIKFIWSAWNIYNPNEYILFSPIKYWKRYHIFDKKMLQGYISNRKKYKAHYDAGLPIIRWSRENFSQEILKLENGSIKKINNDIKKLIDKVKHKQYFAEMIVFNGEIRPVGMKLDNGKLHIKNTVVYLNDSNILNQLPLWVASKYEPKPEKLELNILMKSGDGGIKYRSDKHFIKSCFIWACLSNLNKCISDGKSFINEMALFQKSKCDQILLSLNLNKDDKKILAKWKKILNIASHKQEYMENIKYGLQQLDDDINIKEHNGSYTKTGLEILEHKYPKLNSEIKFFKQNLKKYYVKNIENKIFKYELIK